MEDIPHNENPQPLERTEMVEHGKHVQKPLGGMFMRTVPGVDDTASGMRRKKPGHPG